MLAQEILTLLSIVTPVVRPVEISGKAKVGNLEVTRVVKEKVVGFD